MPKQIISNIYHDDPFDCSNIFVKPLEDWNNPNKDESIRQELSRRAILRSKGFAKSYQEKLDVAVRIIRKALDIKINWGIAYSGGKDSTVLSDLITFNLGFKLPHMTYNTRLEYPEILTNIKRWKELLTSIGIPVLTTYPELRPYDIWRRYGYPIFSKATADAIEHAKQSRNFNSALFKKVPKQLQEIAIELANSSIKISGECCNIMKKRPAIKLQRLLGLQGSFLGIRGQESQLRKLNYARMGPLYYSKAHDIWICTPLFFFNNADIKHYLEENNIIIEYPDTETGRSGCYACGFGCHLMQENSFQYLERTNSSLHRYILDKWGFRNILKAARIPCCKEEGTFPIPQKELTQEDKKKAFDLFKTLIKRRQNVLRNLS